MGRSYPHTLKKKVLDAVLNGATQIAAARTFDVPAQTVNRWVVGSRSKSAVAPHQTRSTSDGLLQAKPLVPKLGSHLVGRVVYALRGRSKATGNKAPNADQFGQMLGIPGSTLRNLEAGRTLPETSLALALAKECQLSLSTAFLLFAFARSYDECLGVVATDELALAMHKEDSRFGFIIDRLQAARDIQDRELLKDHFDKVAFQDRVRRLLQSNPESASIGPWTANTDLFSTVSPVLLDTIYAMAERLKLFHPALDETALAEWEHANRERIRQVIAYYSEPQALIDTISSFTCEFLGLSDAPIKYVIILKGATKEQVDRTKSTILRKAQHLPKSAVIVKDVPASAPLTKAFEEVLWFDTATSKLSTKDAGSSAVRMRTLNLYELRLGEFGAGDSGKHYCAFVDNKRPLRLLRGQQASGTHFTRALRKEDVERTRGLLAALLQDEGIQL